MCELFGISSDSPADIRSYLTKFYRRSSKHPHGWGLMRENEHCREIIKEPVSANESRMISSIIHSTQPQTNALAHIRLATVGSVKRENCHPFTAKDISGREWTMIHNGTIYSGIQLVKYLKKQVGDTDSERIFLYLLDEINKACAAGKLDAQSRFDIIEKITVDIAPRNKLNLMIYDGELLYVHKNMKGTLSVKRQGKTAYFCTQPLDNEGWEDFPMAQLQAFKNGELVISGTPHKGIFIPTLEYITAMDAMNI